MTKIQKGVVAAGHEETVNAAVEVLAAGGNAFDAIVAAFFSSCVAEPVLSSLGGGGYMLGHTASGQNVLYDFFVQTPKRKKKIEDVDFHPISADFGTIQQEFHIGLGSIATPGCVKGVFDIHRDLCTMPMKELVGPAIDIALNGVPLNSFHAYIFDIINPILKYDPSSRDLFCQKGEAMEVLAENDVFTNPHLAGVMEVLAYEGERLFYEGEIAQSISRRCENGGYLEYADMLEYKVEKRRPLRFSYGDATVFTNPPPSSGGILIAFALELLEKVNIEEHRPGSMAFIQLMAEVMSLTNKARLDVFAADGSLMDAQKMLNPGYLKQYEKHIVGRAQALRGTTHMSVMDKEGNIASMSVSNGEGCGYVLPDTGIMLNNMLGEEDLNPIGFHSWQPDQRMTSMMAPTTVFQPSGLAIAMGSGGSNRLRTAILQVLVNLLNFKMPLEQAVEQPRLHYENNILNIEPGPELEILSALANSFEEMKVWQNLNLFFGGTHTVMSKNEKFFGAGDPRRGGVTKISH